MQDIDLIEILTRIPAFKGLKKEQIKELVPMLEEEHFRSGSRVIQEGAIGDSLYIIARGSVNIFKSGKGKEEMLINSLKKNQYFGEVALIDNLPRSATVVTRENSVILRLRKTSLDSYLEKSPEAERVFYKNCLFDMIHRYRQISSDISFFWSDLQEKSITLEEINKDLSSAKKLQDYFINMRILDHHSYPLPGIRQSFIYNPTQEIGGDFINLTRFSEHEYGGVIADVMGHGITAALAAGAFKSAYDLLVKDFGKEPARLLAELNRHFYDNISFLFASCHYAYIDMEKNLMKMARAGHYYPLFYSKTENSLKSIKSSGLALGIVRNAEFETVNLIFHPADKILFYTDGIVEVRNKEGIMYSEERLRSVLMERIRMQSPEILKDIELDCEEYASGSRQEDDISLLLLEFSHP